MQKKMRRLIVSFLAVAMIFGLTLTVSAASSQPGSLGGKAVNGLVSISSSGATAKTTISVEPTKASTTVVLSYSYINTQTDKITAIKETGIGTNLANASLSKPSQSYYRSWNATAAHTVSYSGQKWTANTEIFF